MARYFFDTYDGEQQVWDDIGVICVEGDVGIEAVSALPDLAKDNLPDGMERDFWVRVRDESGNSVFEASLSLRAHWLR